MLVKFWKKLFSNFFLWNICFFCKKLKMRKWKGEIGAYLCGNVYLMGVVVCCGHSWRSLQANFNHQILHRNGIKARVNISIGSLSDGFHRCWSKILCRDSTDVGLKLCADAFGLKMHENTTKILGSHIRRIQGEHMDPYGPTNRTKTASILHGSP